MFYKEQNRLVHTYDNECLWIEPWGKNSLRIRSTCYPQMSDDHGALLDKEKIQLGDADIRIEAQGASIQNGNIKAVITQRKTIQFYNQHDELVLEEYIRQRAVENDTGNEDVNVKAIKAFSCTLKLKPREFHPHLGGDYRLITRFESDPKEKIFGMGQYQEPYLDLKNCTIELAQRNSQSTVPFY